MSPRLISYPTGWTLAVLDHAAAADALIQELAASGVSAENLVLLRGPEAEHGLERLGTSRGLAARIRRTVQFMTMDQLPDLHVYELAIERGHAVIGLKVADAEERRRAIGVLVSHGAHFINRFGEWATEEIAPWRGPTLDLPQHMRR
ncbi:MAG: hypothetical protein M3Y40_02480 [Chloroflexota bacterium]|nr:hypothetical protein [Chloroflexota bacterium]